MLFRFASVAFMALIVPSIAKDYPKCKTIAEIACGTDGEFTSLCAAVIQAELDEALDGGKWTVFAPTDQAFDELLDELGLDLEEIPIETLKDILLYHAVPDKKLDSDDIAHRCGELLTMANGKDSRTVCYKDKIFQNGIGNPDDDMPEIIEVDIEACNGIIHVVDEVLLPFKLEEEHDDEYEDCETIADIACGSDGFEVLCAAVIAAGLDEALSDGLWTVFAPTDKAFHKLLGDHPIDVIEELDIDVLTDLLMYHVVADDAIYFDDLVCRHSLVMANGEKSFTECYYHHKYQFGYDNYMRKAHKPKIIVKDVEACNGVIQVVDDVLLPKGFLKHHYY